MKNKSTRGSWLVTVPLAGMTVAFLTLLFLPGQRRLEALRRDMHVKQDFVLGAGQMAVRIHTLDAELAETRKYNAAWRLQSADSAAVTALCGRIAQLAQDSGVAASRFAPGTPEGVERLQRIPLEMVCYGSFAHIQAFLAALESLPQRVWLNDLKLQASGETGEAVRCELAMAVFVDDFGNLD
jgi:Tfp pilus assembly protein PilO